MKNIYLLSLLCAVLFFSCKEDDGIGGISDPAEVANLMNANLNILSAGAFTVNPEDVGIDNSISIGGGSSSTVPILPGQAMANSISFNAPNGNVTAVGMRFGTSGPIYFVPVNANGNTSGSGSFDFLIDAGICANLSQICHDIRCYEFAQTSAGNISAGNIRDVAMICGNCDEPSCAGLVDPSDCDPVGGGGGGGTGLGTGSFQFSPTGSQSGDGFCSADQGGLVSITNSNATLVGVNVNTSGSVTFTADRYTNGCTTCPALQVTDDSGQAWVALSGSGSWGGNSFNFSGTMIDIQDLFDGTPTFSISGEVNCQ